MTDLEVMESFNNAWWALCRQYKKYPDQMTIDEWLNLLND